VVQFVYRLCLAFELWYTCFKNDKIILICLDFHNEQNVRIISFCKLQTLFSAIIQKPLEKMCWVFVKKTSVTLTWQVGQQKYTITAPLYEYLNQIIELF